MAITAKISSAELSAQVEQRFVGKYIEALLLNASGLSYTPGSSNDANFLSNEVAEGTGGYTRQIFVYQPQDQGAYADDGVSLTTKGTIFAHDGSATPINFTHAMLTWGQGNVISLDAATIDPATGADGIYTDIPTTTDGSGIGLTVDITVSNDIFVFTPSSFGRNYAPGDAITIAEPTMVLAGIISEGGGVAQMLVGNVSSNNEAGNVIAVARTSSPVVLDGGNEAAFYWDLKMFGIN